MGISGNSVAGKSYQSFTVSEELLAKVVEAVQAGEKKARSSGDIQSFEVFYHGMRQNISCGRIYVVPPAVANDRKNFPTALLYGCVVRVFGGEEVGDLIEKKIGESEFDEYSQADFDSIKKELFEAADGKEACLIVYAPNWHSKREYISFHFTKDSEQLKNNLRHQVFSAYYDPRVSSAFNAMMTNVDTTKVDVTDITPKMNFPGLAENPLKQYPLLMKQASDRRTVLLNYKTADAVTKEVLDPQELDVFDSLNQALENSLVPGGENGAQGEGGFTAPATTPGVPREASKQASEKDIETNPLAAHETPITNVGPGTDAATDQKDMVRAMKDGPQDMGRDEEGGEPIGIEIDEHGLPIHKGDDEASGKVAADKAAKRTKGMIPTMDIKPFIGTKGDISKHEMDRFRNGGYVEREHPDEIKKFCADLGSDKQSNSSIADHAKEIKAGLYGDQPLSKSATEKWGEVKIAVNFKKKANDEFTQSYITTALWSSNDNSDPSGGEPLDRNYDETDIAPATLRRMAEDCADFQEKNAELLQQAYASGTRDGNPGHAGHDFWLTRNGHGAGFWDSDYPQPLGDQLTKAAKGYGEADLYLGDDNYIYQSGAEGDEELEPKDPKGYNPTGQELEDLSREMGIQGSKQAKQARAASYVASQMGKIVDNDGTYGNFNEAASLRTIVARDMKEAKLAKLRGKEAVSLDIDSIWEEITEDMGPAPLIDVPTAAPSDGEQVAEGGDNDAPATGGGRPNKRDVGDLPEAFRSDEPEDEKSMSDSEADAQEDSTPESKEAAWRVDNKYADFVSDLFDETQINEGGPSSESLRAAEEAIQNDDDIIYDVAANAGQMVDNVRHMEWFRDAVAEAIEEQGQADAAQAEGEAFADEDQEVLDQPEQRTGSSKKADTADNDVNIDGAANPPSKETGDSKTVGQHKQYDQQQNKGGSSKKADTADNPANEDGGEGAILPKTDKEITNTRGCELPGPNPIGGKTADTADNPANEDGGEGAIRIKTNKEITNTRGKDLPSANPIGGKNSAKKVADTADNPDNMTDGPGTKIRARAVVSDTSGPTPVNTKQGGRKQADTADNPSNEKGGEGAISPKTDADIKVTANGVSEDIAEAKSEVVSPDTVDPDIQQPTVDAKSAAGVEGDMSEAKSELDYSKSEMADEPMATDTVNPEHFAGDDRETCAYCDQKFDDNEDHICPKRADWAAWECDNCSNMNAGGKCLRCGAKKPGAGGGELPAGEPKSEPRGEKQKSAPKSEPKGDQGGGSEGGKMVVRMPAGSKIDPDNAQWTNRFEIKSESSDRLYRIAQNKNRGYWACSCPGWISRRNCKHLRALGLPGNEQPFEATLKAGSLSKEAFDAKLASYGDEFPEETQIDFGAGDLADIVMTEDTDDKEA